MQSHLGSFAITTVGKVNNEKDLIRSVYENGCTHFLEMRRQPHQHLGADGGAHQPRRIPLWKGWQYMQECVDGSMTVMLLTEDGIYAARDKWGRTPLTIGKKEGAYCVSFENFAYGNLGYTQAEELGPGEIVRITTKGVEQLVKPRDRMKICTFLWCTTAILSSSYEGVNVERCVTTGRRKACRSRQYLLRSGGRCAGFRHGACHRLCQPFRHSVCPPVHQIHAHLASLVHAAASGAARSHRPHEAESRFRP